LIGVRMRVLAAAVVLLAVLPAAQARASAYTQVLHVYQTRGSIPSCEFSSAQLAAALHGVDTYGAQYFADFTTAIQGALAARASGACAGGAGHAGGAAPAGASSSAGTGGAQRGAAVRPGPVTSVSNANLPAPLILLGALAALLALVGTGATVARLRGWDPAWAAGFRHSWGEAGFRVAGAWSEFVDWLRSAG
jgi:hypothetical protein